VTLRRKKRGAEVLRAHFIFDPGAGVVKLFIHKTYVPTDTGKIR
jgi:hypothetical protein